MPVCTFLCGWSWASQTTSTNRVLWTDGAEHPSVPCNVTSRGWLGLESPRQHRALTEPLFWECPVTSAGQHTLGTRPGSHAPSAQGMEAEEGTVQQAGVTEM